VVTYIYILYILALAADILAVPVAAVGTFCGRPQVVKTRDTVVRDTVKVHRQQAYTHKLHS